MFTRQWFWETQRRQGPKAWDLRVLKALTKDTALYRHMTTCRLLREWNASISWEEPTANSRHSRKLRTLPAHDTASTYQRRQSLDTDVSEKPATSLFYSNKNIRGHESSTPWEQHILTAAIFTGLLKLIVGVLTTCHTQYTSDSSICIFLFNRTTLQVFVTYLTGALYVHHLWFYKH